MMFNNTLDPFFEFLCNYKPQNDGFVIDGVYYRWIKDYVRSACPKMDCNNCLIEAENEDCIEDIFTPLDGNLRHLYAAYLINNKYDHDKLKETLKAFEENQDVLEYMFSWLRQDYKPFKAFFNFNKYLGALHDWGYKLEAAQRMKYWAEYAVFLSDYKPRYEGFELYGVHYYDLSHFLHAVCKKINKISCIICPIFAELGFKGSKEEPCWHNDKLLKSNKIKIIYLSWWLLMGLTPDNETIQDMMMDFDKNWVAASALFSYINDGRYKIVYMPGLGWQVKDLKKENESGAYAAPPNKQETTWPLDKSYNELDAEVKIVKPTDSGLTKLDFSGPLTMTMSTDDIDEVDMNKILGNIIPEKDEKKDKSPADSIAESIAFTKKKIMEAIDSTALFKGVKEIEPECTMSLKLHKALKEKPTSNGAYWCACADVMDGNILEKCFWREVTFFNGMWCVDDGTLVLAWMALPPSQNPRFFF